MCLRIMFLESGRSVPGALTTYVLCQRILEGGRQYKAHGRDYIVERACIVFMAGLGVLKVSCLAGIKELPRYNMQIHHCQGALHL